MTYWYTAGDYYHVYIGRSNGAYRYYNSDGYQFSHAAPEITEYRVHGHEGRHAGLDLHLQRPIRRPPLVGDLRLRCARKLESDIRVLSRKLLVPRAPFLPWTLPAMGQPRADGDPPVAEELADVDQRQLIGQDRLSGRESRTYGTFTGSTRPRNLVRAPASPPSSLSARSLPSVVTSTSTARVGAEPDVDRHHVLRRVAAAGVHDAGAEQLARARQHRRAPRRRRGRAALRVLHQHLNRAARLFRRQQIAVERVRAVRIVVGERRNRDRRPCRSPPTGCRAWRRAWRCSPGSRRRSARLRCGTGNRAR